MKIRQKLTIAFLAIALLVGVVGYVSLDRVDRVAETVHIDIPEAIADLEFASRLDELSHFITYYDEVLTQSARNYAFTGDKTWKKRYRMTEPKLDLVIKEAIRIGGEEERKFFSSVDAANLALVEMELQALKLVDKGERGSATSILESDEYWKQKATYKKGLDDYINIRGSAHLEAHLVSTKRLQEASKRSRDVVHHASNLIFFATIFAIALAVGLSAYIGGSITRPIDSLATLVKGFARGNIPSRNGNYGDGEIRLLADTFFDMTDTLKETTVSVTRLMQEVEERKAAVAAYRKSELRLKVAQKISSTGDWELNIEDGTMNLSDEACRLLGLKPGATGIHRGSFMGYVHPEDRDMVEKAFEEVFKGTEFKIDHRIIGKDGTERMVHQQAEVVRNRHGTVIHMAGTIQDITDRKRLECKLEALSTTDELTGLYNRRGFFAFGDRLMKVARRENRGVYLLYCDLDGLKAINDRFGHKEGDAALVLFANILKRTYRETDVIARIGGDEFAVFPVISDPEHIEEITGRLYENTAEYNRTSDRRYNISASAGVAYFDPADPVSMDELLARGDKIMYEVKSKRKSNASERSKKDAPPAGSSPAGGA